MRFIYNAQRFTSPEEIADFRPELLINLSLIHICGYIAPTPWRWMLQLKHTYKAHRASGRADG